MIRGRKHTALTNGRKAQGQCPYGYEYERIDAKTKRIKIQSNEADAVRMIFRTFLDTGSTTKTAKTVNDAGYRTKRGKAFNKQGVQTILQNDFYVGMVQYSGQKKFGQHEPLISKHLFTKVQKKFKP